jgi:hypothetical protein
MKIKIRHITLLILLLLNINLIYSHEEHSEESIDEQINQKVITYGSSLRLVNIMTKFL